MLRPGSGRHRKDGVRVNNDKEAAATAPFPLLHSFPVQASRVYPRVGGGNAVVETENGLATGLSPRGRGKLHCETRRLRGNRSIPAWAGETSRLIAWCEHGRVYPRVGGGNTFNLLVGDASDGLSPRGRGKPLPKAPGENRGRSIPAWAGETSSNLFKCRCARVYPRVGGGNNHKDDLGPYLNGLSPRGRGKPNQLLGLLAKLGSIPAWAGETRRSWRRR